MPHYVKFKFTYFSLFLFLTLSKKILTRAAIKLQTSVKNETKLQSTQSTVFSKCKLEHLRRTKYNI